MRDDGLQGIAVEARNRKSSPGIFQTIMIIIFVLPIIWHGIKWGWIFPLISLSLFEWFWEDYGVIGLIVAIFIFIGSIILFIWRFRIMRAKRKSANTPKLYTPSSMRDYD